MKRSGQDFDFEVPGTSKPSEILEISFTMLVLIFAMSICVSIVVLSLSIVLKGLVRGISPELEKF